jgi:hypothetical protein
MAVIIFKNKKAKEDRHRKEYIDLSTKLKNYKKIKQLLIISAILNILMSGAIVGIVWFDLLSHINKFFRG